jgi:hypothetical protein
VDAARRVQQLQFLQVQGAQRQPPFAQPQVQAVTAFSLVVSIVILPFARR